MNGRAKFAWGLVIVVAVVHFDFWAWEDDTLVFGFVPMALAFHAALSVAAAVSWLFVVRFAWPAVNAGSRSPSSLGGGRLQPFEAGSAQPVADGETLSAPGPDPEAEIAAAVEALP